MRSSSIKRLSTFLFFVFFSLANTYAVEASDDLVSPSIRPNPDGKPT